MDGFEGFGLHAQGVELFWAFTTLIGLVLMTTFFFETRGDRTFNVEHKINGARAIVANSAIRRQGLKVAITFFLALPAVLSLFYEVPTPEAVRAITLLSLSVIPILILLLNVVDRLERVALADYFENATATELLQETDNMITAQEDIAADKKAEADGTN